VTVALVVWYTGRMESTNHPKKTLVVEEGMSAESEMKHIGKPFLVITAGILFFIVLTLSLGFGLGLGLKHHHSAQNSTLSATSTQSVPTAAATSVGLLRDIPSWRRDPSEYSLDMDWDINAKPITRVFNLTISSIAAAPDGKVEDCMFTLDIE